MTNIYDVRSYKGGVGVTTTACALALRLSAEGQRTLLVSNDSSGDAPAWLGLPGGNGITPISGNLDWVSGHNNAPWHHYDAVVVDNGLHTELATLLRDRLFRVLVVRNDYVTLRNNLHKEHDIVVAFISSTNALSAKDVELVLGHKPVVVPVDPAVQRTIDAGLTQSRSEHFSWADEIVAFVGV